MSENDWDKSVSEAPTLIHLTGNGQVYMRRKVKILIAGLVVMSMVLVTSTTYAAGPLYEVSKTAKITRKLLRGLINVPFCWVEIPKTIGDEVQNLDPVTGFFTGLAKGGVKAVKRLGSAAWDIFTFPIPYPEHYKAFVDPEFPFMEESLLE